MILWEVSRTEEIILLELTSYEIPNLDLRRNYFFFLQPYDWKWKGWWGDRKGRSWWSLLFWERRGGFTPCLQISLIRLQDLLEGYLPGPIWFSETGDCKVWNGMGEAELIALNFWCTISRGSFLTSQFSFIKYIFCEGNTAFSGELLIPGGVSHWSLHGNTHSFANWQTVSPTK